MLTYCSLKYINTCKTCYVEKWCRTTPLANCNCSLQKYTHTHTHTHTPMCTHTLFEIEWKTIHTIVSLINRMKVGSFYHLCFYVFFKVSII